MKNEFELTVYVQPGAKKSEICGLHDGHIKIKIHSPPVDGKANDALIVFISKLLGVSKSSVCVISGEKSRIKKIKIINIADIKKIEEKLSASYLNK